MQDWAVYTVYPLSTIHRSAKPPKSLNVILLAITIYSKTRTPTPTSRAYPRLAKWWVHKIINLSISSCVYVMETRNNHWVLCMSFTRSFISISVLLFLSSCWYSVVHALLFPAMWIFIVTLYAVLIVVSILVFWLWTFVRLNPRIETK